MSVHFAQTILRLIDEQTDTLEKRLVAGRSADWTDYRAMVSERMGLLKAREIVTDRFSKEDRESFSLNGKS